MQIAIGRSTFSFEPSYAALALTTLLWSSNFVIGRGIRGDVSPSVLNFLRWGLALLVLLPIAWRDLRAHRAALLRCWKLIALLGLTGIAAFQTLAYVALTMTTALNTMLLLSLSPFIVALLSRAAHGERMTRRQGIGLVASIVGAAVLVLHGDLSALGQLQLNGGDLWMLLALCLWAIAFVAVFSSALAHGLWVRGVAAIGANRASVFVHLIPLFGAALAIAFLGESVAWFHAVGATIVLGGVALASRS